MIHLLISSRDVWLQMVGEGKQRDLEKMDLYQNHKTRKSDT